MKIVIAIDSFKGSLSSMDAGRTVETAAKKLLPNAEIAVYPMADGGEGTVDALAAGLGGEIVPVEVTGPIGEKVTARYGKIKGGKTAVIEMADAAGLPLVPPDKRNPLHTTTYGLGELILAAAEGGCREFLIGIGGSATNDCGIGMLTALGFAFRDAAGNPVGTDGKALEHVRFIERDDVAPILKECSFRIACDVTNPLCGDNGCSAIYGPQKGATPEIVKEMDEAIRKFAAAAEKQLSIKGADLPGAGAAGGLGFAFHAFLGGQLAPGVDLVLSALGIKKDLQDADVVITGEGRMDNQTAMGKAPVGIAKLAKACRPEVRTIALCGCAAYGAEAVNEQGLDAYFPILHTVMPTEEVMKADVAKENLARTATQVLRLIRK